MNETEERVVDILTSHPRSNIPWVEPMQAVAKTMKWNTDKTRVYVEYLMHRKYVVVKNDEPNVDRSGKLQSWWDAPESS